MINSELNSINQTNTTVQNLSNKIRNESLKYSTVVQILNIIGFDCCWTPINCNTRRIMDCINELHSLINCEISDEISFTQEDILNLLNKNVDSLTIKGSSTRIGQ